MINQNHVVLNSDKFQFHYSGEAAEAQIYYCTPSYEESFVIILWTGEDGLPEALLEYTHNIFNLINRGDIIVDKILSNNGLSLKW